MTATTKIAAGRIADELIARIQSGVYAERRPLPSERELCTTFEASRPTIREAISRLELLGYLDAEPGHRPKIRKPSLEQIVKSTGDALFLAAGEGAGMAYMEQLRQFIESGAVRAAVKSGTAVQIAAIKARFDANQAAIGTEEFPETDIQFHREIVAVVNNPLLLVLHDQFVRRFIASRREDGADQVSRDNRVVEEHRKVVEAILSRDEAAATELMDEHLERSYRERLILGLSA